MPGGFQAFGSGEGFVGGFGGGGAPPNTFPTIATLTLRLESDLGVTDSSGVTHWLDQVQGIDFVPGVSKPAVVANQVLGQPAVRFNGTTDKLETDALLSAILTGSSPATFKVIAVMKNNSVVAHAGTSYDNPAIICTADSYFAGMAADSTRIDAGFYAGPDAIVSVVQATGALIYVESTLTVAAGGTLSLRVGTAGTPTTATGKGAVGLATGFLKLGVNYANAAFWHGDLFALYVATSMTAQNITDLQTYLHAKYGV